MTHALLVEQLSVDAGAGDRTANRVQVPGWHPDGRPRGAAAVLPRCCRAGRKLSGAEKQPVLLPPRGDPPLTRHFSPGAALRPQPPNELHHLFALELSAESRRAAYQAAPLRAAGDSTRLQTGPDWLRTLFLPYSKT